MPDQTNSPANRIARRAVLRGAGVTMALPWLESFTAKAAPGATAFPKRFGVVFLGNEIKEDHWWSKGGGAEMKFGKSPPPLEPLKHKVNMTHGLLNKMSRGLGVPPPQTGSLLTGATLL